MTATPEWRMLSREVDHLKGWDTEHWGPIDDPLSGMSLVRESVRNAMERNPGVPPSVLVKVIFDSWNAEIATLRREGNERFADELEYALGVFGETLFKSVDEGMREKLIAQAVRVPASAIEVVGVEQHCDVVGLQEDSVIETEVTVPPGAQPLHCHGHLR
jgi:hypothetical protein